jgi:hypothetical protein
LEITKNLADLILFDEFTVDILVGVYLCAASGEDHIIDEFSDALAVGIG